MFGTLFLSSIVTGLLGTAVMLLFLYLPLLWSGLYYDTLGAIGSIWTRAADGRGRLIGAIFLFAGGVAFAMFYGAFVLMFMTGAGGIFDAPAYRVRATLPATVDLFFPLAGMVAGFGHGIYMSLIASFVITDFHPLERFRDPLPLIVSFLVGHTVFGLVVTFFQHQLLQLMI